MLGFNLYLDWLQKFILVPLCSDSLLIGISMYYVHRRFNSNAFLPHMSMCTITARVIQSCSLSGTTRHLNHSLPPLETEVRTGTHWKISTPQISHCCVDHTESSLVGLNLSCMNARKVALDALTKKQLKKQGSSETLPMQENLTGYPESKEILSVHLLGDPSAGTVHS